MGFLLYISYHGAFIYSYGILLYGCIPSGLTMTKIKDYDLITVDEHRIQTTIDVYFQWKTLDIMLSTLSTRGINFPSEISENIVCYTCGYFLNKGSSVDEKYLYTKGKYKGDIYDKLVAAMDDSNAVYQWRRKYVRKNMSGVVPTLTANQGEGGHNVCLVKTKQGIRKMTPKECFNTQGFPESFVLPDIADGRLYKQAGNSVCVSVVQRIAEQMLVAMK